MGPPPREKSDSGFRGGWDVRSVREGPRGHMAYISWNKSNNARVVPPLTRLKKNLTTTRERK